MASTRADAAQVRRFGLATYPAGARLGPRSICDREFAWIIEGEATVTYDGRACRARPGDLVVIAPGVVHEFAWSSRGPTRHGYIHFSLADQSLCVTREQAVLVSPEATRLCVLLGYLLTVARRAEMGEAAALELLHDGLTFVLRSLAFELASKSSAIGATRELHPAIARAIDCVESLCRAGVAPKLTVTGLARHCGLSEAHLSRLVRARYGQRLSALLRNGQLNQAMELLDRTDLTVRAVADAVGYEDCFAFSRAFKRAFGASPLALRAALRAGGARPQGLPQLH